MEKKELHLFSPAKINLFLRVLRRREDGYHDLASLFQALSLGDFLHFTLSSHDQITCTLPTLPCDQRNLIYKARELFRQKTGCSFSVSIHLEKHIPLEAGLGGGSSNAATTLWALNQLAGKPATEEELCHWAGEIGSDISFFFSSGTAYCTGRGEIVKSLPSLPQKESLWLIKPPEGLSTPSVFKNFQPTDRSQLTPDELLESFYRGKGIHVNDLEPSAFRLMPALKELKDQLFNSGLKRAMMTGSGTAFFCYQEGQLPPLPASFHQSSCHFLNRDAYSWYSLDQESFL